MFAFTQTAAILCELRHQQRQHDAAQERLVASAHRSGHSTQARLKAAPRVAATWLHGQMLQRRGQQRVRIAPP